MQWGMLPSVVCGEWPEQMGIQRAVGPPGRAGVGRHPNGAGPGG